MALGSPRSPAGPSEQRLAVADPHQDEPHSARRDAQISPAGKGSSLAPAAIPAPSASCSTASGRQPRCTAPTSNPWPAEAAPPAGTAVSLDFSGHSERKTACGPGTVSPAKRLVMGRAAPIVAPVLRVHVPCLAEVPPAAEFIHPHPGRHRLEKCKAGRLAILNDAAAYFGACGEALLLATEQVYILGWDTHSLTRLVGPSGKADDDYPGRTRGVSESAPERPARITDQYPELEFSRALYAAERGWNSTARFTARRAGPALFLLRLQPSLGFAQHQKIVVIDGAIAFSGGLDLHDKALGHQRAQRPRSASTDPGRQALSAASRRAAHGGRRSGRPA